MLTSITPLGERGRKRRWGLTATWYLLGSTLGGAALGALAGALGTGLSHLGSFAAPSMIIAGAGCLLAAVLDVSSRTPRSWRRQVDENWLGRYRGWVVGGGFGVQLGFGLVTIVSTASVYAMLLLAVLTRSFGGGLAVGSAFGLVRALPLLTVGHVRSQEALAALYRSVHRLAPVARLATVGVLVAAAGWLFVGVGTGAA